MSYYSLFVTELDKSRALDILRELRDKIGESHSAGDILVDSIQVSHIFTGGYQLNMKVNLDVRSKAIVDELLKRHKLYKKEENGRVTLRSIGD